MELDNVNTGISDATEYFNENYTSGIFGFGSYLMGSELLTLNLGVRIHWGFTDMVNEAGKDAGYPIVVEALKDPTKKTLATAAQLQMELNYAFIIDSGVLGEDGNPTFALQVIGIHDEFTRFLVILENLGSLEDFVYERCLSMIDVGDDGDIPDICINL